MLAQPPIPAGSYFGRKVLGTLSNWFDSGMWKGHLHIAHLTVHKVKRDSGLRVGERSWRAPIDDQGLLHPRVGRRSRRSNRRFVPSLPGATDEAGDPRAFQIVLPSLTLDSSQPDR